MFIKWKKVVSSLSLLAQKKKKIPTPISPEVVNHELVTAAGEGRGRSGKEPVPAAVSYQMAQASLETSPLRKLKLMVKPWPEERNS